MKQESQRRDRLGFLAGQIAGVFDRGTEAGRADHGAVAAGEASLGHVIPARVVEIAHQELTNALRLHRPTHRRRRAGDDRLRRFDFRRLRGATGQAGKDLRANRRAGLSDDRSARRRRRARSTRCRSPTSHWGPSHRDAKAGTARLAAINRDDEGAGAPGAIVRVDMRAIPEDPILDRDCLDLAGAHADECESAGSLLARLDCEAGRRRVWRSIAGGGAGAGISSRNAGRRRSRRARRRHAVPADSVPPSCSSVQPAGRSPTPAMSS